MSTVATKGTNFRDAAITASVDALAAHAASGGDPMDAGVSYCLPAVEDTHAALRGFVIGWLWRVILAPMLLLGAAAVAWAADESWLGDWPPKLIHAVAVALFAGGMLVAISAVLAKRRFLKEKLGVRYDALVAMPSRFKAVGVGIEDAATYHKAKLTPEDFAIAVFDPQRQRLVIEGLSHSYVIHVHDIVSLKMAISAAWGLQITYRCGDAPLAMVLTHEHGGHRLMVDLGLTAIHQALKSAEIADGLMTRSPVATSTTRL